MNRHCVRLYLPFMSRPLQQPTRPARDSDPFYIAGHAVAHELVPLRYHFVWTWQIGQRPNTNFRTPAQIVRCKDVPQHRCYFFGGGLVHAAGLVRFGKLHGEGKDGLVFLGRSYSPCVERASAEQPLYAVHDTFPAVPCSNEVRVKRVRNIIGRNRLRSR